MAEEKVTQHYVGEEGEKYHSGFDVPANALPWIGRSRAAKFQPEIGPDETIVEWGVGAGWNLANVACRRRLGFDVGHHLAPKVESLGIEFVRDPRELQAELADVVICHHVLEHVLNPPEALGEMRRLLKPGGKLLLYVPYEMGKQQRTFHRDDINHHLYSWNVQTMCNLVEEVGFRVASAAIGEYGYDRFAAVWAHRVRGGAAAFAAIRSLGHLVRPGREVRVVAVKTADA